MAVRFRIPTSFVGTGQVFGYTISDLFVICDSGLKGLKTADWRLAPITDN